MNAAGIMQGRLSPALPGRPQRFPWSTWQDEFTRAGECGFAHVEWLVTAERVEQNPLWSSAGVAAIIEQTQLTGVTVRSVCADCFIENPFIGVSEADRRARVQQLEHLIDQAARLGAAVVLVPLLEGGAIRSPAEGIEVIEALAGVVTRATQLGMRIGIESDLPAAELAALIARAGTASVGAYYDLGNAAARGADAASEIRVLGARVCGVHIKDRHRAGASVSLGEGAVDFAACFESLAAVGYAGPMILETPVGHDPAAAAQTNLAFVRARLGAGLAVRS